jgi:hypothetical protein
VNPIRIDTEASFDREVERSPCYYKTEAIRSTRER